MTHSTLDLRVVFREFRDVVFEDVGLQHDWRCGDFTPKVDMGEGFWKQYVETPHPETPHLWTPKLCNFWTCPSWAKPQCRARCVLLPYVSVWVECWSSVSNIGLICLKGTRGSQGMGVLSDSWFDAALLSVRHMFEPSCLTDDQTPFLGTPLVPLTICSRGFVCHGARAALRIEGQRDSGRDWRIQDQWSQQRSTTFKRANATVIISSQK